MPQALQPEASSRFKSYLKTLKREWFGNIPRDILAGMVVALALIPEAIAFSIIAGVDPMVGLYASFSIAVITAIVGGRPAMISAATGAMALLMVPLVKEHGLQYLLATTILTGIIQLIFGILNVAKFMQFVPNSVMIGFVNALGILIFIAQLQHFVGGPLEGYLLVGGTLALLYFLPKIIPTIPAPLIAILLLTPLTFLGDFEFKRVGDLGLITQSLPSFLIPDIPFNFATLKIIFPYAFALSIVGLLESLLTARILDDLTKTESNKNREARGQGMANIINGFFGGMAGCAMIGQSVINVRSGGRGRLSTFVAGAFLMFLIIVLGQWVIQIPMPVLAGIMIMVCIDTFEWRSFKYAVRAPKGDVAVMLLTIVVIVYTRDLSKGVFAGIILSALLFMIKISTLKIVQNENRYTIFGQLFFGSTDDFIHYFKRPEFLQHAAHSGPIILDFSQTHLWDESAAESLQRIEKLLTEHHITFSITGLSRQSRRILSKLEGGDFRQMQA